MKLLIHAHAYPDFVTDLYTRRPELRTLGFDGQFAAFDREAHIFGNAAWAEALRPFGYDVMVIVGNCEALQKAWAGERGVGYGRDTWQTDIAEAQLAAFRPDLLFFTSYLELRPGWVQHLRASHPSVRMVGLWCGMPFGSSGVFGEVDLVLSCVPELRDRFRSLGVNARHLHHAFDERVLGRIEPERPPDIAFSFVGQLIQSGGFHRQRVRHLERIAKKIPIEIYSPAAPPGSRTSRRLKPFVRPPVFGLPMYRTLRRSRVTFNSHIDAAAGSASNRRLFEATGVGSCLLTDHKPNLRTLFEPDREVVTFNGSDDCVDKARWLLDHPRERERIAEAGQRRTLAEHTYARRAAELDSIIREELPGAAARRRA